MIDTPADAVPRPILISASPSPFVRKVRVALAEKGVAFDLVREVPWHDPAIARAHGAVEKLPILVMPDDGPVVESSLIVEYIDRRWPLSRLIPAEPSAWLAARMVDVIATGICEALILALTEGLRAPERRNHDWIIRQRRKMETGIAEIARLAGERDHIVGEGLTIADISTVATLAYVSLRLHDLDWRLRHPNLARYHARLMRRPSFASTESH